MSFNVLADWDVRIAPVLLDCSDPGVDATAINGVIATLGFLSQACDSNGHDGGTFGFMSS